MEKVCDRHAASTGRCLRRARAQKKKKKEESRKLRNVRFVQHDDKVHFSQLVHYKLHFVFERDPITSPRSCTALDCNAASRPDFPSRTQTRWVRFQQVLHVSHFLFSLCSS
jgi:hypothetical protein